MFIEEEVKTLYDKITDEEFASDSKLRYVKNKINKYDVEQKLKKWMSEDYSYVYDCELHYHLIERKIFIEEYKSDEAQKEVKEDHKDYKN